MIQLPLMLPAPMPVQQALACQRLQEMVDRNRNSYETQRYRERRAAALKGRAA